MYCYSKKDLSAISLAYKEDKPWNSKHVSNLKSNIKESKRKSQDEQCCYCLRDIKGEYGFGLHLEHILPKSIFKCTVFDSSNLGLSCQRCNIEIKKLDYSFSDSILEQFKETWSYKIYKSEYYKIVHPNLDIINDHIEIFVLRNKKVRLTKYFYKTEKGKYTYNYFKLKDIEIKKIDESQGINTKIISSEIRKTIEDLFEE